MKLDNIKRVFCENTGGGTMVDFIELNDECVVLYESMADFYDCDNQIDRQVIILRG